MGFDFDFWRRPLQKKSVGESKRCLVFLPHKENAIFIGTSRSQSLVTTTLGDSQLLREMCQFRPDCLHLQ